MGRLLLVVLFLLIMVFAASGAPVVVNGGFETGDFSGWTLSGNVSFMGVDSFLPHSGRYEASVAPVGALGYLSQIVETEAGMTYNLSFWLANDGGTPNEFQALWGGTPVVAFMDAGPFAYTNYSVSVLATGSETELRFGFRQDPFSFYFDDVVIETVIPEPATYTLTLPVIALIAYWRRRGLVRT